jgi:hypothetical protein
VIIGGEFEDGTIKALLDSLQFSDGATNENRQKQSG